MIYIHTYPLVRTPLRNRTHDRCQIIFVLRNNNKSHPYQVDHTYHILKQQSSTQHILQSQNIEKCKNLTRQKKGGEEWGENAKII